ncbi:MAG: 5'-nucleotidase C-terminal domain-containing protein, partial [Leptospiraceae bacterium]|nr:5'-nucleotidase C-terminal domain-containing protein [Leptospiraceae bacterium]
MRTLIYNLFFLFAIGNLFCIHKKAPPPSIFTLANIATTTTTSLSVGAPKSIGLNLVVDKRQWTRGCETRAGNLIADSYAWKGNADIGMINGGNIRDDQGVSTIPKGTIPTIETFGKFMIFANNIQLVRMNAYRLKQALENAYRQLTTTMNASNADDLDEDGPQHGNCFNAGSGSGRFMQLSSNIQVELKLSNAPMTLVSGTSAANNNLKANNNGSRVVRMIVKGLVIYNNPSGTYDTGWASGSSSCTVRQTTFTNSAACNFYTVAVPDFQVAGGDGIFSFNPAITASGASP